MFAPFERFISLRYLRGAEGREEGKGFLRFIIFAAVGGVAVGVAALVLALSIVRGFSEEIENQIVGFGAHIQVQGGFGGEPLDGISDLENRLRGYEGVQQVVPVLEEFALIRKTARQIDGVSVVGMTPLPDHLTDHIVQGTADVGRDEAGRPGVLIGSDLAGRLNISAGDEVALFSVARPGAQRAPPEEQTSTRPRIRQFHVAGVFETAFSDFDDVYVFADVEEVRDLLGFEANSATRVELRLHDVQRAEQLAAQIEEDLGFPHQVLTVYDVFSGLFAWVNLQETITPLIIAVIVIVAAFNIIGTLLMLMMEKSREIGVLSSLGASSKTIKRLFLWVGGLIGGAGIVIGQVLALTLALIQIQFEVIPLPAEAYYMSTAPISLSVLDFLIVGAAALVLCLLAAYIPARVASSLEPVRTIRFE